MTLHVCKNRRGQMVEAIAYRLPQGAAQYRVRVRQGTRIVTDGRAYATAHAAVKACKLRALLP